MGFFGRLFGRRKDKKVSSRSNQQQEIASPPTSSKHVPPPKPAVTVLPRRGPDLSDGTHRVLRPNNQTPLSSSSGPVDLDASDIETDTENVPRVSPPPAKPLYQFTDFSAGQVPVADNDDASSFNLSTDAEDSEYEDLKRRGVLPNHPKNGLDTSVNEYTTDGETSVFPLLPTDDERTTTTIEPPAREDPLQQQQQFLPYTNAPRGNNDWNINNNININAADTHRHESKEGMEPATNNSNRPKPFTTPKSSNNNNNNNNNRGFNDFADFSHADAHGFPTRHPHNTTTETSLSELLAQAKSKSSRKKSSVNSAPALTSSYLREHHKLKGRYPEHTSSNASASGASVSDIIKNLEAANAARSTTQRSSDAQSRGSKHSKRRSSSRKQRDENDSLSSDEWLFDEVTGALGPRGIAADLESLSGRSNRSHTSKSRRSRKKNSSGGESVGSHGSKRSRYSHRSTRSYLSQMSEQSRSVANDLLRLEMQLAMVGGGTEHHHDQRSASSSRKTSQRQRARRHRITVTAPPGKLGIILANKADSKGTVVSGVRTSSVLAEQVAPGDRIVAIDGEDVSLMTVSEITTIMARKSELERTLTVLTTPRQLDSDYTRYTARTPTNNNA